MVREGLATDNFGLNVQLAEEKSKNQLLQDQLLTQETSFSTILAEKEQIISSQQQRIKELEGLVHTFSTRDKQFQTIITTLRKGQGFTHGTRVLTWLVAIPYFGIGDKVFGSWWREEYQRDEEIRLYRRRLENEERNAKKREKRRRLDN